MPAGAVYVEPFLRRVRGVLGQRTLIDSERVLLVHRPGSPPSYAFPAEHVRELAVAPEPAAEGYVRVAWDAVSSWYEEEEQVSGHPKNPYHRVDCIRARRRLRVELDALLLVDTTYVIGVYETSRAPQLYAPRAAVRMDLLVPSTLRTYCPYKGTASHWSALVHGKLVPDVAWSYDSPVAEAAPIAGWLSFYSERTTMTQDVPNWFSAPPPRSSHA